MSKSPVICFGQQPCGFFPRRFLFAKIQTARRLQAEIGGEIVFFYHDSDHDPRETRTTLRHRSSGEPTLLNFAFANKIQRKHSPLYLKRVLPDWQEQDRTAVAPLRRAAAGWRLSRRAGRQRRRLLPGNVPPAWDCSKASASCAPAIRDVRRAAVRRRRFLRRCALRGRDRACPSAGRRIPKLHEGGDVVYDIARRAVHQGADQPDARQPAALDAIGDPLHALRRRRRRASSTLPRRTLRKSPTSTATPSSAPMKPTPTTPSELAPLLAFGAHPDDIEFGCGGVIARETRLGRPAHFVVCSRGEAGTTARPRSAPRKPRKPPQSSAHRSSSSSSTATPTWKFAPHMRSRWPVMLRRIRPAIVLAPTLGREPASRPFPARPAGARCRPARPLWRPGGTARLRRRTRSIIFSIMRWARRRAEGYHAGADRRLGAGDHRGLDRRHGGARLADAHARLCEHATHARPPERLAGRRGICHRSVSQRPLGRWIRWQLLQRGTRIF